MAAIEKPLVAPLLTLPDRTVEPFRGVLGTPRPVQDIPNTPHQFQRGPDTQLPEVSMQSSSGNVQRLLSRMPRRIMGFSMVGGSVMVMGIVLLFVLVNFLHVEEHLAYLIQAVTSIETNFFLNRFLNWKERDGHLVAQWLKFHSTSAITFPLNQALFAFLTWIGVQYLVVTVIGAGVAAIVNYLANDRFVFHRQDDTKRETVRVPAVQPLIQVSHVGVVIPVRNSQRTIRTCLASILEQDFAGHISVFLVGNVPEQDATWSVLEDMLRNPRIHCIQIRRPAGWVGRDANIKRYCGCEAAIKAGVDVLALIDSQVVPPRDWLANSVQLLQRYHIDGVAGRSYRNPADSTFPGIYQDCSLFSEWPSYGKAFFLSQAVFGKAKGLPVTNNLLITKSVWKEIHRRWPLKATYSWEDFHLAWEITSAGYVLCCTDTVYVYRHHKPKFRLAKHFAAGAGAVTFYQENPTCLYAKRMLVKAGLVSVSAFLFVSMLIAAAVLGNALLLAALSGLFACACLALGTASVLRARDIRGMVFPVVDMVHIAIWIAGAAYTSWRKGATDATLADALIVWR